MKKLFGMLLTVGVLLTGCGGNSAAMETEMQSCPKGNQQSASAYEYRVEMETIKDVSHAESGEALASYRVRIPVLKIYQRDGEQLTESKTVDGKAALDLAEKFNQGFSTWRSGEDFAEATAEAESDLKVWKEEGRQWYEGYSLELDCSVYQTAQLISVYGICYSYTGGAHPNSVVLSWNFDVESGTFFDGELLAADSPGFRKQVKEELIRQACGTNGGEQCTADTMLWPEYENILADWTSYAVSFDDRGMTVAFSPYELAPYAAGEQIFHLPYEWLQARLGKHSCKILGLECKAGQS